MERENYFFDTEDGSSFDKLFILIIYDIVDNKKRQKLAKFLLGYGFRIQKSAFEAVIGKGKYEKMLKELPFFVSGDDSIRVYKIIGKGQVKSFGKEVELEQEDVILL